MQLTELIDLTKSRKFVLGLKNVLKYQCSMAYVTDSLPKKHLAKLESKGIKVCALNADRILIGRKLGRQNSVGVLGHA